MQFDLAVRNDEALAAMLLYWLAGVGPGEGVGHCGGVVVWDSTEVATRGR